MSNPKVVIGVDYGTNSVRAIVVDPENGSSLGESCYNYPCGSDGIILDPNDHNLARQNPQDYLDGLESTVTNALKQAGVPPESVIGIGVDTTGSTPIPVDSKNHALCMDEQFAHETAAMAWLWKDHTSVEEASIITKKASEIRPQYLAKCGGAYSSEWFWSKIFHCLNQHPNVFDAAHSWVECADWIPSVLSGVIAPEQVVRGICAAGHKAMFSESWGGLPDKDFLKELHPKLAELRDRLYSKAVPSDKTAGKLCQLWASKLGLPVGIPIAAGEMDAHFGAVGAGISEGVLVKIMGTSTCDCVVSPLGQRLEDIPGICGIVEESILPGYYGLEAGQSAVGDIFNWFVKSVCQDSEKTHQVLTDEVSSAKPGQAGLLALDWNNGNRNILADQQLSGLLLGQSLHTTRAEIYRALIESTAFGARVIIERMAEYGVHIDRVICCGGLAKKNAMLMQIYADVTGRTMQVASSEQTCALGSAIAASVVSGYHTDFLSASSKMTHIDQKAYSPIPENQEIYNELYSLYMSVHDAFGGKVKSADLSGVMKKLLKIKAG